MTWTIEYAETAKTQLHKLDKQMARRIVDYMNGRVAEPDAPRSMGNALTGPLGGLWCWRVMGCRVIYDIQDSVLSILVMRSGSRGRVCH